MHEELNDLKAKRPNVVHITGNPVDEQIEKNFPEYFDRVVRLIRKMGALTELNGWNEELDEYKNQAYKLIGL